MTTRSLICWTYCGALVLLQPGCGLFKTQVGSASRPAVEAAADVKANVKGNAQVGSNKDTKQIQHGDNNKIVEVSCSWTERIGMPLAGLAIGWLVGKLQKQPAFMEKMA